MEELVRLLGSSNIAEAEMLAEVLRANGIQVVVKRDLGQDIPGLIAGGRRQLMVSPEQAQDAKAILDAMVEANKDSDKESAAGAKGSFSSNRRGKGYFMLMLYCLPVATIVAVIVSIITD